MPMPLFTQSTEAGSCWWWNLNSQIQCDLKPLPTSPKWFGYTPGMRNASPIVASEQTFSNSSKHKNCLESCLNTDPGLPLNASDLVGLGYSMWICSSNKLPEEADATSPEMAFWIVGLWRTRASVYAKTWEWWFPQGYVGSGATHNTKAMCERTRARFVFTQGQITQYLIITGTPLSLLTHIWQC